MVWLRSLGWFVLVCCVVVVAVVVVSVAWSLIGVLTVRGCIRVITMNGVRPVGMAPACTVTMHSHHPGCMARANVNFAGY